MCHMHMIFCTVEAKRRQCLMHVAYMLSLVGRRQQRRKRIALARFRQHPVPLAARLPHVATHGGAGQPARRDFVEPMLQVTLFAPGAQLSAAAALAALYFFVLARQVPPAPTLVPG